MPLLSIQVAPDGPVLIVLATVSQPRFAALQNAGQAIPPPVQIRALIDTGASCTAIDPQVIQSLGLTPTGTTQIVTPSTGPTAHTCNQYDIGLWLVHGQPHNLGWTIPVIEAHLAAQGIQALIGRDVLARCLLVYNGQDGFFSLAF